MHYLKKEFKPPKVLSVLTSLVLCFIAVPHQSFSQCPINVFVNEFHYDNEGIDVNEFIEVAVPAGVLVNLADYQVTLYNGNGGGQYDTENLSNFLMGATDANYTYYVWQPLSGIQNGPDGIAITTPASLGFSTCDFISYEGSFIATDGPAMGQASVDVGVSENNLTPIGSSLQLINGVWTGPIAATPGNTNVSMDLIMISEISLCDQAVELQNVGATTVDISNWQLCNFPAYAPISSTLFSGSPILAPGDFLTVQWNGISPTAGEIGLYIPGTAGQGFGLASNIRDYVQYNNAPETRAPVAVAAGVWDDVNIAISADDNPTFCMSSIANGISPTTTNSTTWCTSQMNTYNPTGPNSACFVPTCGITALAPWTFTCSTSTPGSDMVQIDVAYTGVDPNAILSITVNGSQATNIGSNPNSAANGTISFLASEGDSFIVTFADPACSVLIESGSLSSTLCITCPNVGDLVITEIMQNPVAVADAMGEYFEVYNGSSSAIDMIGLIIKDDGTDSHTIASSVVIPAGSYAILSNNANMLTNGGLTVDYQYSGINLSNSIDEIVIECNGTEIDRVNYSTSFPLLAGSSMIFDPLLLDGTNDNIENDSGSNWCLSSSTYGGGDKGTPGATNDSCSAICGITSLGNFIFTCQSSTAGVDGVKVDISYSGVDPNAILSITVNGSPVLYGGSNPQTTANGTISFPAMEGAVIVVSFTDPLCSNLTPVSATIPLNLCPDPTLCSSSLYIQGVIDGPLSGGTPKAIQLCANANIMDLSLYSLESVNPVSLPSGPEYTFPATPLQAGECIWVATEPINFDAWFGFTPCYIDNVANINGDDAIILYCATIVIDQFGDPSCDPNAVPPLTIGDCGNWEYMDGWAFAKDNIANPIFDENEWGYSMENALDFELNNATAAVPYPLPGTMCPDLLFGQCPDDYANGGLPNSQAPLTGLQDVNADYEADGDIISDQVIGSINPTAIVDYDSGTTVCMNAGFEVFSGVTFHAFIDGCGGI